jgi:N-acetylmuramoyl-L-alanine amidase
MKTAEILGGFRFITGPFLRSDDEYKRRERTDYLVVHCADTKPTWDGGAEEIREWHVNDNHWLDIGYHFVIRRNGDIEQGRPVWAVGSGVAGHNSNTIHVCLVGGQDNDGNPDDNFTAIQKSALAFLLAQLKTYVAPKAQVCGHRDFPGVTKACPSFDAKSWWNGVQQKSADPKLVKGFTFIQAIHGDAYFH